VLGVADSLRVGTDTAFSGVTLTWPFISFAARSTAARAYLALDPDVLDLAGAAAPATPDDLFEGPTTEVVRSPAFDSAMGLSPPPSAWSAVGKSGAKYAVTFSWAAPHGVTITKKP